jgi:hypothetical protein
VKRISTSRRYKPAGGVAFYSVDFISLFAINPDQVGINTISRAHGNKDPTEVSLFLIWDIGHPMLNAF